MSSIDINNISESVRLRRANAVKEEQDKINQEHAKKDQVVKNEITGLIEKDVIKQIELEEKQEKLKKYYEIIKEEEIRKREAEQKEQFKQQCASIIQYENSYVKRYLFKFLVWGFISYAVYFYVKSFF